MTQQDAEFSRIIAVDELGEDDEKDIAVSADAAERAALAGRLGLVSLDRFEARVHVTGLPAGAVAVHGAFEADVVQTCVVTLDPVASAIAEIFDLVFEPADTGAGRAAPEGAAAHRAEIEVTLDDEDPPEPMFGRRFDIAAYLAEYLALAIDPYPRKEGISLGEMPEFEAILAPESGGKGAVGGDTENPFSVLRRLTDTTSRNS